MGRRPTARERRPTGPHAARVIRQRVQSSGMHAANVIQQPFQRFRQIVVEQRRPLCRERPVQVHHILNRSQCLLLTALV